MLFKFIYYVTYIWEKTKVSSTVLYKQKEQSAIIQVNFNEEHCDK